MAFDVFISHPHQDKAVADAACAKLEAEGIRCWIAPRDIAPSADWAGSIIDAIDGCRVMILIFSEHANRSRQVRREVQHAFEKEKPVVPFRIENVMPEGALAYYMPSVHWLDALTPPVEQHLEKLVASVKSLVQMDRAVGGTQSEEQAAKSVNRNRSVGHVPAPQRTAQPLQRALQITAGLLGLVLLVAVGVWTEIMLPAIQPPAPVPSPAPRSNESKLQEDDNAKVQQDSIRKSAQILRDQGLLPIMHEGVLSFRDRPAGGQPCAGCPEIVVVPRGNFLMGSDQGKTDETPPHRVTFAKSFAAGKFSVTRGEFAAFVNETGYRTEGGCNVFVSSGWQLLSDRSWRSPGFDQDDRHPVVCTNGNDAKAFVAWLSRKTASRYRLLTEAEWEYAARAGTTTVYYFGDNPDVICRYANGADLTGAEKFSNWPAAKCRDGYIYTSPVGTFEPNAWGLHDAVGNVRQRVADCYNDGYSGAPTDGSAWMAGSCDRQVLRGGSWSSDPFELRSASRDQGAPFEYRYDNYGFRVAREINQ
jgi:formylglycine-generating enzyme